MSLDAILWEDLNNVQGQTDKAIQALHRIRRAIQEGQIGQPTHEDSKRLDRLMVLAELLLNEIRGWTTDLEL